MKTSLVIMAAGIGSRFSGGIKALAAIDDAGHIIMDYSVHDAILAGFNRIVFIIRRDIENDFREVIGNRIERECARLGVEVCYAFQDINDIPGTLPEGRTKPWGTCHAVLAAKEFIDGPFAVVNADDYYGKESFRVVHNKLVDGSGDSCMAGFVLRNTLSDNGSVTRGICSMDENGMLESITETYEIFKTTEGAESRGNKLDINSLCSMNMWGLQPEFISVLEKGFAEFFESDVPLNPMKAEFLLPAYIGKLLKRDEIKVCVCKTNGVWYGMTYKEDVPVVYAAFKKMLEGGKYREELFLDL